MNVTIDHQIAEMLLIEAVSIVTSENWQPQTRFSADIRFVILEEHLTYRYILLNGLLARATNEQCNPLTLQASSSLPGAFDARSLCHNVVVKVERSLLKKRLGGSNEPFLNKPARNKELSVDNPVRKGKDSTILRTVINILSGLESQKEAREALNDCIYYVFERPPQDITEFLSGTVKTATLSSICTFGQKLLLTSSDGESCVLLAGMAFDLIGIAMEKKLDIRVHPVNQSGRSSKEVSDIDVFYEEKLLYTSEVKDKIFSKEDVEHAVSKVVAYGHSQLFFLVGPRGCLNSFTITDLQESWRKQGFDLIFLDLLQFFESTVAINPKISTDIFFENLNKYASLARVKDSTYRHIQKTIEETEL